VNPNDLPVDMASAAQALEPDGAELLSPLLRGDVQPQPRDRSTLIAGAVVGELLALAEDAVPLVRYPGQARASALRARTSVDLHGSHIGAPVVLMFEDGNPDQPIVVGVLRGQAGWPLENPPAQVEVDVDGQRMVVSAREQLVLRCGKASITLTKAGKVLIEGSYLLSRSTGVNRIKGGSVQLN